MRITVKANPAAREQKIKKLDEANFVVSVVEPPIQGRANRAVISALSEYFKVSVSKIRIISGHTSRIKTLEVEC